MKHRKYLREQKSLAVKNVGETVDSLTLHGRGAHSEDTFS